MLNRAAIVGRRVDEEHPGVGYKENGKPLQSTAQAKEYSQPAA
jgi:hypothetical protein